MFIPYNTDAPIYHWPYGTVVIIAINTLIFAVCMMADPDIPDWIENGVLIYGEFNPYQWVMSNFLHADFMHLLGNMLFLWGFGLVVEGKLGWQRFVPLYLAIGILQCMLEQILMFGSYGGSLGASSVIFGMMAIAAVWAPRNNMSCLLWLFRFAFTFEMPIYLFCILYTLLQFALMGWGVVATGDAGAALGSEFLHLLGMVVAAPIAVAFVKLGWVDCDGWDIFSMYKEANRPKLASERREQAAQLEQAAQASEVAPAEKPLLSLQQMLADGAHEPAIKLWHKHTDARGSGWELEEMDHKQLTKSSLVAKEWEAALILMKQWLTRDLPGQSGVRVQLAELFCKIEERPSKALKVLAPLDPAKLPEKLQQRYLRVKKYAQKMIDEGHLELATDE